MGPFPANPDQRRRTQLENVCLSAGLIVAILLSLGVLGSLASSLDRLLQRLYWGIEVKERHDRPPVWHDTGVATTVLGHRGQGAAPPVGRTAPAIRATLD
jgi:hypothetical protein